MKLPINMNANTILKLIVSIALPLAVGGIAGFYTSQAIPTWYTTLNRPSFNPPNWLFGPVWTTLYLLMGISLYMIWSLPSGRERNIGLLAFGIQLVLNFGWSFIFFYYRTIGLALIEIVLLWVSIVVMIILFYKLKPLTAYLNIPYLLWVSFATALNAAYYHLNH